MNNKRKAWGSLTVLLVLLLCLAAAGRADENTINSLYTTPETSYLGGGFNSIIGDYIFDNTCMNFKNVVTKTVGGVSNSTYYCFVDSKKELEDKFLYNFSGGGPGSAFITAKSKVTQTILDNTNFSTDKITLIAYWKQEDKKIFSNDLPSISEEALAMLKADPKKFFQTFGNQYVSAVTFGKIFFIVYQADISKYTNYSIRAKNSIRRAVELSLRKIMGSKLSNDETTFVTDKIANVQINSTTYGNDIPDFAGPYTADEFRAVIKKVNGTASAVITRELKNYAYSSNGQEETFYDISDYLMMVPEWKKHLSYLNYISSNTRLGIDLYSDCNTAKDNLENQLKLVTSLDTDARMPNNKELTSLNNLYSRYITRMQIVPRMYNMQPIEKQLDLDLSSLTDVETIKIEFSFTNKGPGFSIWNIFGNKNDNNKSLKVILYIVDEDGNLSEVQSVPITKDATITLYEGIKFSDKFKIGYSDPKANLQNTKIMCSFTEKTNDVIWQQMYSKSRNDTLKPTK